MMEQVSGTLQQNWPKLPPQLQDEASNITLLRLECADGGAMSNGEVARLLSVIQGEYCWFDYYSNDWMEQYHDALPGADEPYWPRGAKPYIN